jgi:hypothetical protein
LRPTLYRLNHDGTQDSSFAIAAGLFLPLDPDAGFELADGSLDSSFDVGAGASTTYPGPPAISPSFVNRIVLQADGQILVAGRFTEFDGFPRAHLVRLNGDGKNLRLGLPSLTVDGRLIGFQVFTGGRVLESIEIQAASSLSSPEWKKTELAGRDDANPPVYYVPVSPAEPHRFFRAISR